MVGGMAGASEEARVQLRWQLADECNGPQQALFEDEPPTWRAGHGEFRGLEFLEVKAQRVINPVPPQSRMSFRYTINAYRGCSHACSYCASGDTPILMADGRTKPLADLRIGDRIFGTERRGSYRRYVVTTVLDHWSVVKPSYRTVLEDGTELITSGDHRFLSDRGWLYVKAADCGCDQRPFLTSTDRLTGPTGFASISEGMPVARNTGRRVKGIETLTRQATLYDITTGTGDFLANGVVSHNCFARPTHEYLNLNIGRDFERRIVVKVNAVERVRAEVAAKRWAGELIAMGTNTDPYQRCEGKYRLTRGIVEVLGEARNPFSILTKSTLILRDLDVLAEAAKRTTVQTAFSVGTVDDEVWKLSEPGTPHPRRRLEALVRLREAGIPAGVLAAPILPGISDSTAQLEALARALVEAGVEHASPIVLHLRPGVKQEYLSWLADVRPDLLERYDQIYGRRSYAPKAIQAEITARFQAAFAAARRQVRA
jgi:DNA repair photolyase